MNVINRCRNLSGTLSATNRNLLARVFNEPSEQNWQRARWLVISPSPLMTLDMAVKEVSRSPSNRVPDPFTIYRAMRHAVFQQERHARRTMTVR
jgi:hypothetical protein